MSETNAPATQLGDGVAYALVRTSRLQPDGYESILAGRSKRASVRAENRSGVGVVTIRFDDDQGGRALRLVMGAESGAALLRLLARVCGRVADELDPSGEWRESRDGE